MIHGPFCEINILPAKRLKLVVIEFICSKKKKKQFLVQIWWVINKKYTWRINIDNRYYFRKLIKVKQPKTYDFCYIWLMFRSSASLQLLKKNKHKNPACETNIERLFKYFIEEGRCVADWKSQDVLESVGRKRGRRNKSGREVIRKMLLT